MIKNTIKLLFHTILGYENYLFVFSLFTKWRLKNGLVEKEFLHFCSLIPKIENSVILDIGANIGVMTSYLAENFKTSKIYAFEPIPYNLNALERVIKYNNYKNVEIFPFALGEEDGTVDMLMPVVGSVRLHGTAHIAGNDKTDENKNGEVFKVMIKKIDNLSIIKDKSIVGIKIDVEDYEYFVLQGGVNIIKKNKPVIYSEVWNSRNSNLLITLLEELGYTAKICTNNVLSDYKISNKVVNVIFIHGKMDN